jgi:hypothetical protein
MKRKDYIYIGAYVLFFGFFITTLVEELQYQDEQFKKINKLNNDLLKISQYVQRNLTDFEYLEMKIEDNSVELDEVKRQLQETQDSADSFYQMFFDTQPQRIAREEEELVEEIEDKGNQDKIATPLPTPSEAKEQEVVELPVEMPVVKITPTASCPTPNMSLLPYIKDISLRRNYSFKVTYDVENSIVVNTRYTPNIPNKLKRGMDSYLNSFKLNGDITDCYVPIKILGN